MSAIRHDGYTIRDLSFQFSLMILGAKMYVETEEIWSKKISIYEHFFGEFERTLKPALLTLAINLRTTDDEIRNDSENLKIFEKWFKNNIILSNEILNLLIEKSNADRNNLRNEIEKIKSYSLNKKKLELDEVRSLINFSGDYKSDILINECLCGNISQYKKIISELYVGTANQIFLLRILSNKIQRLLKIKEQENKSNNLDNLISASKPAIFWKEKLLVKKQLSIWNIYYLKKIIEDINNTELLCKKNPQISNSIFFNFCIFGSRKDGYKRRKAIAGF